MPATACVGVRFSDVAQASLLRSDPLTTAKTKQKVLPLAADEEERVSCSCTLLLPQTRKHRRRNAPALTSPPPGAWRWRDSCVCVCSAHSCDTAQLTKRSVFFSPFNGCPAFYDGRAVSLPSSTGQSACIECALVAQDEWC